MKEAKTEPGCPEKGTQKPRFTIPKPTEGEKQTAVLPRLSPIRTQQMRCEPGLPPSAPHPARGLTCSSLRRKGAAWRAAARARGLGEGRVPPLLITPLPRPSSSAPGVPPHTPSQGERPAATPGSLHLASALQRGRCSASTRGGGRWGRIYLLGLGRGAAVRGAVGPSSLAPNRFWPADSGPTGWLLVANVIWGTLGGPPRLHQK